MNTKERINNFDSNQRETAFTSSIPAETQNFIKNTYWIEGLNFVQKWWDEWYERVASLETPDNYNIWVISKTLLELIQTKTFPDIQKKLSSNLNIFLAKKAKAYWINFSYNEKNYLNLLNNLTIENPDFRKILFEYNISENLKKKIYWSYLQEWLSLYDSSLLFDRNTYQKYFLAYLTYKNVNEKNFDSILISWKKFIYSNAFQRLFIGRFESYENQWKKLLFDQESWIGSKTYWTINLLNTSEVITSISQIENVINIAYKDPKRAQAFEQYYSFLFQNAGKYQWIDILKTMSDFCKTSFEKYFSILNMLQENNISLWNLKKVELANILSQRLETVSPDSVKKEISNMQDSLKNYNFEIFGARKTNYLSWDDSYQFPITQKWKNSIPNANFYTGFEIDQSTLKKMFLNPSPMNLVIRAHWSDNLLKFSDWNYLSTKDLARLYIQRKKMWIKNDILITTACFWRNFTKNFIDEWKKIDPSWSWMPIILSETENTQVAYLSDMKKLQNAGYEKWEFWSTFFSKVLKTNNVASLIKQEWSKTYKDDQFNMNFSYFLPTKNWLEQVAETKNIDLPAQA